MHLLQSTLAGFFLATLVTSGAALQVRATAVTRIPSMENVYLSKGEGGNLTDFGAQNLEKGNAWTYIDFKELLDVAHHPITFKPKRDGDNFKSCTADYGSVHGKEGHVATDKKSCFVEFDVEK